jgi:hypothetical protein
MSNKREENSGYVFDEFICEAIDCTQEADSGNGAEEKAAAANEVVFPNAYYRVFNRDWMALPAEYQGRNLYCAISWPVLASRFGAKIQSLKEAEAVFLSNKPKIEEWAKALILAGHVTTENRVMIE